MSFFDNRHVKGGSFKSSASANTSLSANFNRILTRKIIFPIIYHFHALKPIKDDKVIFLEIRFGELTDSYRELFNYLVRGYEMDIHCHFLRQGFVNNRQELKRQIDFLKDAATARYLIFNDSSDTQGSFKARRGTHVMNVWHAAGAFKKFGNSTADKLYNDGKKGVVYKLHQNYDLVTVSSPEIEWAYAEAMGLNSSCVKGVGISRSDVFYREDFKAVAFEHLYDVMPSAKGKKVILYAPTFRGIPRNAVTPDMFEVRKFYEHFKDEYVLLFKHHPLVKNKPQVPSEFAGFAADMTDSMNIDELLCVTDICITDYSSLIFEYSIFEKPMLFFAYDLANYFDWRGFYYNFEELTPGPVCFTNAEMIEYIEHVDERFDKNKVHEFRERFMSGCDGHATERITAEFFGDRIDKYKRPEPIEGDFCDLPEVKRLFSAEAKRIDEMEKLRKKAKSAYDSGKRRPVATGRVVFLGDENSDWDAFLGVQKILEEETKNTGKHFEIIADIKYNSDNIKEFCEKLAVAERIYCAGEPYILRMLDVREETKVIQISPELRPAYPMWGASKEARSGYKVRESRLFPVKTEYDVVYGSTKEEEELWKRNYKLKNGGIVTNDINPALLMLKDDNYKAEAKNRLLSMIPYTRDKKIIAFICKDREQLGHHLGRLLTKMHEDFARTHVCVCMAVDGAPGSTVAIPDYLEGFAFDPRRSLSEMIAMKSAAGADAEKLQMSEGNSEDRGALSSESGKQVDYKNMAPLSVNELISVADVVVTDYCTRALAAETAGKPLFLWMPDRIGYGRAQEAYIDLAKELSQVLAASDEDLIDRLISV
ncbi:CDP-glycerol glycerophosphotransferase family protein [Butyrivibrio sp. XPD2002]|uniref:CDP-glycerol glycerophosphotransferase family protein n=1 Tax=Butyrivibrio sp. XPD2002 TaxID=1280665 RepID=UPI000409F0E9|nr:CDP-glycerol glycerophosphotransferase family protein [Butyrivibrio sp. XPD2002]